MLTDPFTIFYFTFWWGILCVFFLIFIISKRGSIRIVQEFDRGTYYFRLMPFVNCWVVFKLFKEQYPNWYQVETDQYNTSYVTKCRTLVISIQTNKLKPWLMVDKGIQEKDWWD